MSVLKDFEKRLGIEEIHLVENLNFSTDKFNLIQDTDVFNDLNVETELKQEKLPNKVESYDEDVFKLGQFNLDAIAKKVNVAVPNLNQLINVVMETYSNTEVSAYCKTVCKELLNGLRENRLSKQEINGLIQELNRG